MSKNKSYLYSLFLKQIFFFIEYFASIFIFIFIFIYNFSFHLIFVNGCYFWLYYFYSDYLIQFFQYLYYTHVETSFTHTTFWLLFYFLMSSQFPKAQFQQQCILEFCMLQDFWFLISTITPSLNIKAYFEDFCTIFTFHLAYDLC